MLDVLGLDELQERAYRELLQSPAQTTDALADALDAEIAATLGALDSLQTKGLVMRSVANPEHFVAAPPELAIGSLIVERQQEIRRAQLELTSLTEIYRDSASVRRHTDVIDIVRGRQAVAQHFAQLQRGAREEVQALVKPEVAAVSAEENVDEEIAIERGVTYRVVIERATLDVPGTAALVAESVERGEQVRVTDTVPLRLLLADRELALLPLISEGSSQPEVGALLVRPSGLLDALVSLFDLVWHQSHPLHDAEDGVRERGGDRLDEIDRHLLTLLRAGLTDQAIVGQLGLSLRTVQRRVHRLMRHAGVTTRFQLGLEAGLRGWLPR